MFLSSTKSNFPFHCDFNSRLSQLYWTLNGPTRTGWGWPCLKCSVSFTVPVNSVRSARLIWSLSRSLLSYLTHLLMSLLSDCNIMKAFKEKLSDNVHTYPPPPQSLMISGVTVRLTPLTRPIVDKGTDRGAEITHLVLCSSLWCLRFQSKAENDSFFLFFSWCLGWFDK